MSVIWYLNLDADFELERPHGYQRTRAVEARMAALLPRARTLLRPGDQETPSSPPPATRGGPGRGALGRAWCPTPSALRALSHAGATPPSAPSLEVLRRVNHRRFHAELGATLPSSSWVTTTAELTRIIAGGSPSGVWLLKRPYGFAGRGRIRVTGTALDRDCERWVSASFAAGDGLLCEPWVQREADFAQHGYVAADGALVLGSAIGQSCDERGAWLASTPDAPIADHERAALAAAADEVGARLHAAGYFGPFGIDAFRYRLGAEPGFCPRCEINARYTMGWAAGMGAARPEEA